MLSWTLISRTQAFVAHTINFHRNVEPVVSLGWKDVHLLPTLWIREYSRPWPWAFSWGQSLVDPASLCSVLKLYQLRVFVCRLGEDDAVVQPGGLTLPELHQERLDDVAAPVNTDRVTLLYFHICLFCSIFEKCNINTVRLALRTMATGRNMTHDD